MRALRFHRSGSLDELKCEETDRPIVRSGEALVQVRAAAINPSDVKNVLGRMAQTTFPRTPGRDFAGVVMEGPAEWRGRGVFGTGGGSGFTRDGTHAEFVALPVAALVAKPQNLTFVEAAAVGVGYMTAWAAIVLAADLRAGETLLITGATGAVGSAAARIAKRRGARVLGAVRHKPTNVAGGSESDHPTAHGVIDAWIELGNDSAAGARDLPAAVGALTCDRGADVVFDTVAGPLFEPCLRALAHRGRQVAISVTGDPRVSFNLADFYHKEARLLGVDTLALDYAGSAAILRELLPGLSDGTLPPPATIESVPLDEGSAAYARLHAGQARGSKLVLVP